MYPALNLLEQENGAPTNTSKATREWLMSNRWGPGKSAPLICGWKREGSQIAGSGPQIFSYSFCSDSNHVSVAAVRCVLALVSEAAEVIFLSSSF